MEKVLKGLQWQTLLLYLDDVIIFSKDFESHLERLGDVCQRFRTTEATAREVSAVPARGALPGPRS